MRAFTVSVNGKPLCTAGIGTEGVLTSCVNWSGLKGSGGFHIHVGGLDTSTGQHLSWPVTEVGVGDEIVTRIIESDTVDPPLTSRTRAEIEAEAKRTPSDSTLPSGVEAALILRDPQTGDWLPRQIKRFAGLPRIGEWVAVEQAGVAAVAKVVMVVHNLGSAGIDRADLYAFVEGEPGECLQKLSNSI